MSVWCFSDIHTNHKANAEWIQALVHENKFTNDTIIVAGDVSETTNVFDWTLRLLCSAFRDVFFVPGNHDLWCDGRENSIDRLEEIMEICSQLGVHTKPAYSNGAIIAPLFSWHQQSWDTEPDIVGWEGIPSVQFIGDYRKTRWPPGLNLYDDSIAKYFDALNRDDELKALQVQWPDAPLITFSHFVPKIELTPEKRYLFCPALMKAIGSSFLERRIDKLRPDLHIFGHTHFGCDRTVDDIRYIQAPLGTPTERAQRRVGLASFPNDERPTPLLIYDQTNGFPPRYDAWWSIFYDLNPRRPDLCHVLPPHVARMYKNDGRGEVGWFGTDEDGVSIDPKWPKGGR